MEVSVFGASVGDDADKRTAAIDHAFYPVFSEAQLILAVADEAEAFTYKHGAYSFRTRTIVCMP